MIWHTPNDSSSSSEGDAAFGMFNEVFWPYRALSKALLQTQRNAIGYFEANRQLCAELRLIIRREHDLVSEISKSLLKAMANSGNPNYGTRVLDPNEVNEIFDRAVTGMRELSQAWMDAQTHSLDTMRHYAHNGGEVEVPVQIDVQAPQSEPQRHVAQAAPEPVDLKAAVQENTRDPEAAISGAESPIPRKPRASSRRSSSHSAISTPAQT
jgi:hypothetical protein